MGKQKTLSNIAARRVLQDLIIPTLGNPERACLQYFLRHFRDLTSDGNPTTTAPIARKQLEEGSRTSQYVFDLGVGLALATISAAIKELVEKGFLKEDHFCKHCFLIEEHNNDMIMQCPRCNKKIDLVYELTEITPDFVRSYLNLHYDGEYSWDYDENVNQFYTMPAMSETSTKLETPPDYESILVQARNKLWFPVGVDRAVEQARGALKSGKMSDSRVLNGFYKPILDLQEEFPRDVLKEALKVTLDKKIAAGEKNTRWHRYVRAVAVNRMSRIQGPKTQSETLTLADATKALEESAQLNTNGNSDAALEKLKFLLANTEAIRRHFTPPATSASARNHIMEAFKKGLTDYRAVQRYASPHDFLPEWNWGDPPPKKISGGKI